MKNPSEVLKQLFGSIGVFNCNVCERCRYQARCGKENDCAAIAVVARIGEKLLSVPNPELACTFARQVRMAVIET